MSEKPQFWKCEGCGTPNPVATYITRCISCGAPRIHSAVAAEPRIAPDRPAAPPRRTRRRMSRWLAFLSALSLAVVIAALAAIRTSIGPGWAVAILLLVPRLIWITPPAAILLLCMTFRQWRLAGVCVLGILLVLGPIMDLRIPWTRVRARQDGGQTVRLMTFNMGARDIDTDRLGRLVAQERIDVLCFQETPTNPALFAFLSEGWYVAKSQKLATKFPILEEYPGMVQESLTGGRYVGELTRVKVRLPDGRSALLASVHLPTLKPGFEPLSKCETEPMQLLWLWWDRQMSKVIETLLVETSLPCLIGGDFNMAAEHYRFHPSDKLFKVAFHETGLGYGYTRGTRFPWVRIDHVLGSRDWDFSRCWVAPDLGSDHRPVIAEAVLAQPE